MRHTRSSNKQIRKWQLNTIALAMTILLCACGGGGSAPEINNVSVSNGLSADHEYRPGTGVVPEGGNWTASSMAFTVSADGSQVDHFEVSYSGRAHNDT